VTLPADTRVAFLLDQIAGMLRLARALAEAGRPLDLGGLQDLAGRACAAALDLPPDQGRATRPVLVAVLAEVDALTAACRAARREVA